MTGNDELLGALTRLGNDPAWQAILARWERDFKALEAKALDSVIEDVEANKLRRARAEVLKLSPSVIMEQIKSKARADAANEAKELAANPPTTPSP